MPSYPNQQSNPAAAIPVWVIPGSVPSAFTYMGYQHITDLSSAVGLTAPLGSRIALVQTEDGNVRYLRDANPTGGTGMILWATAQQMAFSLPATGLRFINMTGSTSKLNIEYYGVVP